MLLRLAFVRGIPLFFFGYSISAWSHFFACVFPLCTAANPSWILHGSSGSLFSLDISLSPARTFPGVVSLLDKFVAILSISILNVAPSVSGFLHSYWCPSLDVHPVRGELFRDASSSPFRECGRTFFPGSFVGGAMVACWKWPFPVMVLLLFYCSLNLVSSVLAFLRHSTERIFVKSPSTMVMILVDHPEEASAWLLSDFPCFHQCSVFCGKIGLWWRLVTC